MKTLGRWESVILVLLFMIGAGITYAFTQTAGSAGPPLGPADTYFATQTVLGTPFQVDSGRLAQSKGGTEAIRSYAQLMVSSHITVNNALEAILKHKAPLPPPTLLQAAYTTIVATLEHESGPAFDREYVNGQINYQKGNAALYRYEIVNGNDPDLKAFAQQTLPKIEDHLARALKQQSSAADQTPSEMTIRQLLFSHQTEFPTRPK